MTDAPKRRGGRPPFVATDEQRKNVKILVGLACLRNTFARWCATIAIGR